MLGVIVTQGSVLPSHCGEHKMNISYTYKINVGCESHPKINVGCESHPTVNAAYSHRSKKIAMVY